MFALDEKSRGGNYGLFCVPYGGEEPFGGRSCTLCNTGKNNGFPFLDILGYLKNNHKNPKLGKVRQVPTTEFPTKFPD